jgi:hypothetical protein
MKSAVIFYAKHYYQINAVESVVRNFLKALLSEYCSYETDHRSVQLLTSFVGTVRS